MVARRSDDGDGILDFTLEDCSACLDSAASAELSRKVRQFVEIDRV